MKWTCSKTFILLLSFTFILACRNESKEKEHNIQQVAHAPEVVTVRLPSNPKNLNPYFGATSAMNIQILGKIFPLLLNFNPATVVDLEPVLAKSLPVIKENEDGSTEYTYEIREEVVFDNGTPVTGADYIFSLKVLMNPKVGAAAYQNAIASIGIQDVIIDKDNPKKFTVRVSKRSVASDEYTGGIYFYPQYVYDPKELLKDIELRDLLDAKKADALIKSNPKLEEFAAAFNSTKYSIEPKFISGCGPYKITEWITGERIVIEKKENWWGDQLKDYNSVYLIGMPKKIIYQPVADNNAAITLVKNAAIDIAMGITPPRSFVDLQNSELGKKNYNFYTPKRPSYIGYILNTRIPKLADKKVRRALSHMVDMDTAIKNFGYGSIKKCSGPILEGEPAFNKSLPIISLDLDKARTLLAEAGWKDSNNNGTVDKQIDGKLVELEITVTIQSNRQLTENITLLWQENAKKAGVKINIETQEFNKLREYKKKRDFEVLIEGKGRQPFYNPMQSWHTKNNSPNGQNFTGFGNAETDALIEEIIATFDNAKRNELYKKFQAILYEENPAIFLYTMTRPLVIHKKYGNVFTSSVSPGFFENTFVIQSDF